MVEELNQETQKYTPLSHSTAQAWVVEEYRVQKEKIKRSIATAASTINLSFDIWTSDNHIPFLGVEAHYIIASGKFVNILLALQLLIGQHTGENIGDFLHCVINDYGFAHNVGYCTSDNAYANDTAMKHLGGILDFDWLKRRIRCACHILNLGANAGIYGKALKQTKKKMKPSPEEEAELHYNGNDEIEATVQRVNQDVHSRDVEAMLIQAKEWREKGPAGKARNIAVHVTSSVQRREVFQEAQKITQNKLKPYHGDEDDEVTEGTETLQLQGIEKNKEEEVEHEEAVTLFTLLKDGGIRWHSFFDMIERSK